MSRPRKILATNAQPGLSTATTTLSAASTNWLCTNSSMSWSPVTVGLQFYFSPTTVAHPGHIDEQDATTLRTIWCTITHHQVGLVSVKVADDSGCSCVAGDVALKQCNALDGCHWLQVHCHNCWGWLTGT